MCFRHGIFSLIDMMEKCLLFGAVLTLLLGCKAKKMTVEGELPSVDSISMSLIDSTSLMVAEEDTLIAKNIDTIPDEKVAEVTRPVPEVVVSMRKTPCFGSCPSFEFRIYSSGNVIYRGERNVEKIGVYEGHVHHNTIQVIIATADSVGYFDLEDSYPPVEERIPDLPSTITSVKFGDAEKNITNNHNAPSNLIKFEKYLLQILNNIELTKSKP